MSAFVFLANHIYIYRERERDIIYIYIYIKNLLDIAIWREVSGTYTLTTKYLDWGGKPKVHASQMPPRYPPDASHMVFLFNKKACFLVQQGDLSC